MASSSDKIGRQKVGTRARTPKAKVASTNALNVRVRGHDGSAGSSRSPGTLRFPGRLCSRQCSRQGSIEVSHRRQSTSRAKGSKKWEVSVQKWEEGAPRPPGKHKTTLQLSLI